MHIVNYGQILMSFSFMHSPKLHLEVK